MVPILFKDFYFWPNIGMLKAFLMKIYKLKQILEGGEP